jgi:serine protease Do
MNSKIACKLGVLVGLLAVSTAQASAADTPFPSEMLVTLGEPSVYCVLASATFVVKMPRHISVKVDDLQAAYDAAQSRNAAPSNENRANVYWQMIATNPTKFLQISDERTSKNISGIAFSGTAFAVSREGILLTNAHVVNFDASSLLYRPDLLASTFSDFLATMAVQLNGELADPAKAAAAKMLYAGLYDHNLITVETRDVKIELFGKVPLRKYDLRLGGLTPTDEQAGIPARVIATGKAFPGRDVAVLRTTRTPTNLGVNDPYLLDKDRLICLRLADSDDVLPGTTVQALGFPGAAFIPEAMAEDAQRDVSARDGQIGQIKPLKGDMPIIFEMTANINHGDSGGPVIDKSGRVIALNVAIYPIKKDAELTMPGHSLAVPVNVAKAMLKAAGITKLDPGPLAEAWERGLRLYAAKDYAAAEQEFVSLMRLETSDWSANASLLPSSAPHGNPYVYKLYLLCQKNQGKLKLPSRD